MRSALLFYRKLRKELEDYRFKINPEDPCVANKWIPAPEKRVKVSTKIKGRKGRRSAREKPKAQSDTDEKDETPKGHWMTVIWHVDDLMVSCKCAFELAKFQCYLGSIYGPKLTINRGNKHTNLGMDMEFCKDRSFEVSMFKYLDEVIETFPEDIGRATSTTPAASHLFQVREEGQAKLLPEDQAMQFHRSVAQLLFLCCRARQDMQTAVAFLTTRVKEPDEDDWGKLKRVMKYLNGTRRMKLKLTINDLSIVKWYIYGSFNVHPDAK